jgi:hypothetical protein
VCFGGEVATGVSAWLSSSFALSSWVRIGLLVLALAAARWSPTVAALAVLGALLSIAFGGHASESLLSPVLEAAHLLAGAVWLGAAPAVLLVLGDRSLADEAALGVVRRFSRLAAVALVILAVAGSLLAIRLTDTFAGGLTTSWVLILGAKVALVAVAAFVGWLGRRGLAREPRRERFRWLFGLDAALLVAVAVLSSALTLVPPHEGHAEHNGHSGSARCVLTVGDASLGLIATPGTTGENQVAVSGVADGALGVTVEFESHHTAGAPLEVELTVDGGEWQGTAALPFSGSYQVTVVVRVDTFTEARGTCDLEITG